MDSKKRTLDAPSFIGLDKTKGFLQPERRPAIEDFTVGAICLSHFPANLLSKEYRDQRYDPEERDQKSDRGGQRIGNFGILRS